MTFRIPDNEGSQPKDECIDTNVSLDASLPARFPIHEMMSFLKETNLQAQLSTDPGRFICNYIFYKSLRNGSFDANLIDVVFVHTPPEDICPIETQIAFIDKFVEVWMSRFS